jgi:hypothetical protein
MKTNYLYCSSLFFLLFYSLSSSAFAQSIGFSVGATFAHINKSNFNKDANLDDFEPHDLKLPTPNRRVSFALNFEYPLTDKLRLRAEASYFGSGYALKLNFADNAYRSMGFGFMNLQGVLLADYTALRLNHSNYLAVHGGMNIGYMVQNLSSTHLHIRGGLLTSHTFKDEGRAPTSNSSVNVGLVAGASFNRVTHIGKFSIGFNYNRALQPSPQANMKFSVAQYATTTRYDELLSPKIHFLNVYVGYAWFLKKRVKK